MVVNYQIKAFITKVYKMEISLIIIFYYGILHALGSNHLSAIALFSIGKNKKQTFLLTLLFVVGHGLILLIFAYILKDLLNDTILRYADLISSSQINFSIVLLFITGVSIVFIIFGFLIFLLNNKYINNAKTLKYSIASIASLSIIIAINNILSFNYVL